MLNSRLSAAKCKLCSLLLVACMPLMTACDPVILGATTFGAVFWLDIALTPIRSLLGAFVLEVVNTV